LSAGYTQARTRSNGGEKRRRCRNTTTHAAALNTILAASITIIIRIAITTEASIITVDVITSSGGGACAGIVLRSILRLIRLPLEVLQQLLQCERQSVASNPRDIHPGMKGKYWY
jgi:hypothetical protein